MANNNPPSVTCSGSVVAGVESILKVFAGSTILAFVKLAVSSVVLKEFANI